MKFRHCLLLIIALLICTTSNTYAGFLVKKQKQATETATIAPGNDMTVAPARNLKKEDRISNFRIAKDYLLAKHDGKKDGKNGKSHANSSGWEGIVALVCGILSIVGFAVPGLIFLCIPAIIFGILGLGRGKAHNGMALAGLIMGGIALLILILAVIIFVALLNAFF